MMHTIRKHVFETNSSSEHCISFSKEYRTADEFPKLNKDGILEVEIKHYWSCGALGTTTDKLVDIIEYLCAVAVTCASKYPESMDQVLADIKYAYANVGLETPKGLDIYVVDEHKRHIPYRQIVNAEVDYVVLDDDLLYECNFPSLNGFFDRMDNEEFKRFCHLHQGFMYEKVVKVNRQIGLDYNIIFEDYRQSVEDIRPYDYYDDTRYDAKDLLLSKSTLDFKHT